MGKSIRCTEKKRLRTCKRQRADEMVFRPQIEEHHRNLQKVIAGTYVPLLRPKNAFLYPQSTDAVFPQHEIWKPIDYRSENLPMAGYTFRGNRRKFDEHQRAYMEKLAKNHPKMEVIAGGGAVMATTGQKVSKLQAQIIATSVRAPECAAALAEQASAQAAVEAAVEQDAAVAATQMEQMREAVPEAAMVEKVPVPEPTNAVDTSRRPIMVDAGRMKRLQDNRTRSKKLSKMGQNGTPISKKTNQKAVIKKGEKTKAEGDKMKIDA